MKLIRLFVFTAITTIALLSCKKDKNEPQSRAIKYEITGNYSGKLNVVYTNASGTAETATMVTLPWSKEITIGSTVNAIALTASTNAAGAAGQTATAKIFAGGSEKKTETKTADANGAIQFSSLTFTY